jgi:hypothetical protein
MLRCEAYVVSAEGLGRRMLSLAPFIGTTAGGERGALEVEAQEEPRVTIDEQTVNVIRNSDGTYSSEGLFYAKYTSLLELARASIDAHLPER